MHRAIGANENPETATRTDGGTMTDIPEFTDEQTKIVRQSINQHYDKGIGLLLADTGFRPVRSARGLIEVPVHFRGEFEAMEIG